MSKHLDFGILWMCIRRLFLVQEMCETNSLVILLLWSSKNRPQKPLNVSSQSFIHHGRPRGYLKNQKKKHWLNKENGPWTSYCEFFLQRRKNACLLSFRFLFSSNQSLIRTFILVRGIDAPKNLWKHWVYEALLQCKCGISLFLEAPLVFRNNVDEDQQQLSVNLQAKVDGTTLNC